MDPAEGQLDVTGLGQRPVADIAVQGAGLQGVLQMPIDRRRPGSRPVRPSLSLKCVTLLRPASRATADRGS
jgi:hypothetical protein